MKTRILLSTFLMLSLGVFSTASALSVEVNANAGLEVKGNATSTSAKAGLNSNATTSVKSGGGNATSSNAKSKVTGNATSTQARVSAESHGYAVVTIVKSLLGIANRDGGIGAEVRVVAQSQNDSASTTVKAMVEVEKRGVLRKLFFGSDTKNIGQIRSEIVKTENDIRKLEKLVAITTDAQIKADLDAQINALTANEARLQTFIKDNEVSFSLLGWLK